MGEVEKLYKLYNITDKRDYAGSIEKCECTINGEYGLFKERISLRSKDNVMEEVVYRLATLMGVPCAFASCRKHNNIIGSFSRYEISYGQEFKHLNTLYDKDELDAMELLEKTKELSKRLNTNILTRMYQYMILDYIVGQRDRHLMNMALTRQIINGKKIYNLYKLYDNGICCFSTESNDIAIEYLNIGHYNSRLGGDEVTLEALIAYRDIAFKNDLRCIVQYNNVNDKVLRYYIQKADKYKQMGKERTEATIQFILRNIYTIHQVNMRKIKIEE